MGRVGFCTGGSRAVGALDNWLKAWAPADRSSAAPPLVDDIRGPTISLGAGLNPPPLRIPNERGQEESPLFPADLFMAAEEVVALLIRSFDPQRMRSY